MKNFFLIAVLFLTYSCDQGNRKGSDDDGVRKEIKSTIDNYYNDIRKEGLLAELKYLDSSREFFWVPPGYMNYVGYDSISAAIKRNFGSLKSVDNRYDSLLIVPLTNDYVQFVVRTISTTVHSNGDTAKTAFVESGVMVKRKDGWKFLSGHTTILE